MYNKILNFGPFPRGQNVSSKSVQFFILCPFHCNYFEPFSLCQFFKQNWYKKNRNPHFWPFLKGPKCLIQICTIFQTVSLSLIYTFILVALLKICLDVVWLRFIWLDQLPFFVITHIWRSQFICFQTYSTITFLQHRKYCMIWVDSNWSFVLITGKFASV